MRLTDIIIQHAKAGGLVIDATDADSGLSSFLSLPPNLGVETLRREAFTAGKNNKKPLIEVREGGALSDLQPGSVAILLFQDSDALFESMVAAGAAECGREVTSLHKTDHAAYPLAACVSESDKETVQERLRASEYRIMRFLWRSREAEVSRLGPAARQSQANHKRAVRDGQRAEELTARVRELSEENEYLREDVSARLRLEDAHRRLQQQYDAARAAAEGARDQTNKLTKQLGRNLNRLEKSRGSVSFRLGRATKLAIRNASGNRLAVPSKWVEAFRQPDEVLEEAGRWQELSASSAPSTAPTPSVPIDVIEMERRFYLLGLVPPLGGGPLVAVISGSSMAHALSSAARCWSLAPNAWRYQLERENPAYVLVCSDGLHANTPWGSFGFPDGRGHEELLVQLYAYCHGRGIPVVYWDTEGVPRNRLGAPGSASFDAVYTVNPALVGSSIGSQPPAAELLLPGVAPQIHNPIGVSSLPPSEVVFDAGYDRSLPAHELAGRDGILRAASSHKLSIVDSESIGCGPEFVATRFPESFQSAVKQRPVPEHVPSLYKQAGLVACGNDVDKPAFPGWRTIAAIACGCHVLSTPHGAIDPILKSFIEEAESEEHARATLPRMLAADRLPLSWSRAASHLSKEYDLGARLDHIAAALARGRVSRPTPRVGIWCHSPTNADIAELRETLKSLETPPSELWIVSRDHAERLKGLGDTPGTHAIGVSTDTLEYPPASRASHLIRWSPGLDMPRDTISLLEHAAHMTHAEVLSLSIESEHPQQYLYSSSLAGAIQAVETASLLDMHRRGHAPEPSQLSQLLLQGELRQLVVSRNSLNR